MAPSEKFGEGKSKEIPSAKEVLIEYLESGKAGETVAGDNAGLAQDLRRKDWGEDWLLAEVGRMVLERAIEGAKRNTDLIIEDVKKFQEAGLQLDEGKLNDITIRSLKEAKEGGKDDEYIKEKIGQFRELGASISEDDWDSKRGVVMWKL